MKEENDSHISLDSHDCQMKSICKFILRVVYYISKFIIPYDLMMLCTFQEQSSFLLNHELAYITFALLRKNGAAVAPTFKEFYLNI